MNFLASPAILFFLFGIGLHLVTGKQFFHESIRKILAFYLLLAIGLKGGVSMTQYSDGVFTIISFFTAATAIAFLQPLIGNWLLKRTTSLDRVTSAALAAHYGSISLVTFVAAIAFLEQLQVPYKPYMTALMAILEIPAILSGIWLIQKHQTANEPKKSYASMLLHETPLLLIGGTFIGLLIKEPGFQNLSGLFATPFQGILCLFLFAMGELVAANKKDLKHFNWKVISFGLYMPLLGSILSLFLIKIFHLDTGTAFLFMVLLSSASYIAVPAAMQIAAPSAKSTLFVPMTLGISFPFNLLIGFNIYYFLVKVFT